MRLALEFLDEEDRRIIVLRRVEERGFKENGEELGIDPNTARMRLQRALPKLAERITALRRGKLDSLFS